MTQLLQYDCYSRYKGGASIYRHSKEHETPFPLFLGMSVYVNTRKKVLVELPYDHGLSVSYDRVLEISAIRTRSCKQVRGRRVGLSQCS